VQRRSGGEARGGARETSRLFLALFPSPDAQAAAARACEALRSPGDGVSWVKRENLHYTLRFLGELGADGARRALEAAREAASDHRPFGAALGVFGFFPSARRARLLWIGLVEGDEQMRLLASSLEAALQRRGFDRADKPFEPHLTVGRLRVPADWLAKMVAVKAVEARFTVDRVLLMKSTLSPRGSIYEVVGEARLGE
jgi:RNA 2',3'-cyclic 3'-phosphodiesterase